jgi:hypothetical protein
LKKKEGRMSIRFTTLVSKENVVKFGPAAGKIQRLTDDCKTAVKNLESELWSKVEKLRSRCKHNFQNIKGITVRESHVKNVFYAGGESNRGKVDKRDFVAICLGCGELKAFDIRNTCPCCLGKLSEPEKYIDRAKYFGEKYMYYSAMVARCEKCDIGFVWDVWDQ